MSGNFAIKGGGRVGPLMANAILNFHFDYLKPSLSKYPLFFVTSIRVIMKQKYATQSL